MVNSLDKGGRTKRIAQEQQGLENCGHQVTVVTFSPPPEWVKTHFSCSNRWVLLEKKPGKFDLSLLIKMRLLIKQRRTHIVHAHCEASFLYAGLASRWLGVPCIGTYHRSDLRYYQPTLKNRLFARLLNHCVAISNERQQRMHKQLGIAKAKITILHGGIEISSVKITPDIQQLRKQLGLATSAVIIFSAGHLGPIKGHDDSIAAMPQLLKKDPNVSLYIAGDGTKEDYQRLKQLITQYQLTDHVHLLGQVNNTLSWMQACDIFLQPSREEGFGLVFIEAGLCGKPVVSTKVGGIPDIILDGKTGLLAAPKNSQQIAEHIARLLDNPREAASMGQAAKQRVLEHFSLEHQITKLESIYQELV